MVRGGREFRGDMAGWEVREDREGREGRLVRSSAVLHMITPVSQATIAVVTMDKDTHRGCGHF